MSGWVRFVFSRAARTENLNYEGFVHTTILLLVTGREEAFVDIL